jgi:DNA-binding MarR family transcriptional regulator
MPAAVETRSATPALASSLRVAIARVNRRLRAERLDGAEVSLGQIGVIARLHCDGDRTIGWLAESEGVRPPSMTRTIASLEERGLVSRRPHPSDGRQVLITLTPEGRATLMADRRRRDAWLACALSELTPDERAVLAAAAPLLERLAGSRR